MKGVRIRRLMKRSALPSQANFDKYRHIRPKKLFRKGAVPTRECAAPLDGRSDSDHRIGFVPWQKCAFCAFAVDAPKPPYGATAFEKAFGPPKKSQTQIRRAFDSPWVPSKRTAPFIRDRQAAGGKQAADPSQPRPRSFGGRARRPQRGPPCALPLARRLWKRRRAVFLRGIHKNTASAASRGGFFFQNNPPRQNPTAAFRPYFFTTK